MPDAEVVRIQLTRPDPASPWRSARLPGDPRPAPWWRLGDERPGAWRRLAGQLTALLLALPGVPAHAAGPGPGGAVPPTWLRLRVSDGPAVTLRCDPPGGTHPNPPAACRALAAAGGDLERLPRRQGMYCITLYAPVTARATGTWRGHPVAYTATFGNHCELIVATGPVFRF